MKLKLELSQDAELRRSIKQLIKEQVKAIAREEFEKIVNEELQRKITAYLNNNNYNIDERIKSHLGTVIKNKVNDIPLSEKALVKQEMLERFKEKIEDFVNLNGYRLLNEKIDGAVRTAINNVINNLSKINTDESSKQC